MDKTEPPTEPPTELATEPFFDPDDLDEATLALTVFGQACETLGVPLKAAKDLLRQHPFGPLHGLKTPLVGLTTDEVDISDYPEAIQGHLLRMEAVMDVSLGTCLLLLSVAQQTLKGGKADHPILRVAEVSNTIWMTGDMADGEFAYPEPVVMGHLYLSYGGQSIGDVQTPGILKSAVRPDVYYVLPIQALSLSTDRFDPNTFVQRTVVDA